ncbi:AraC family transcriptional regulator [Halospina denitrificans]|uniref:AraC family transcriptional regulator n=1 Tax=Halospina denitrificans TaxID=332522 RepID=A0A4V3EQZ6_9GAMM|nr:AraC family transcriptional regulator [Halospina denitrificans]TDT43178.1 AraC family transcriptional regulator [Halospina denitrificans]
MTRLTVSAHFVTAALAGAARDGFDTDAMLLDAGIDPTLIHDEQARVTDIQYTQLMQVIWDRMQDEFMGFAPGRSRPGTFATLCQLVIHCDNLDCVLRRASHFYALFETGVTLPLRVEGDEAIIELTHEGPLRDSHHFLQESLLVIWHRLSSWLIGQGIPLSRVFFRYPEPPHVQEYRGLFHCPLAFKQPATGLAFPARFLDRPVIRDELEMREFLKTSPADLLARPDDRNSYTARIRALIGRDFTQPLPDFEWIADQLNTSPQTLRRRLKAENTSFQEIKDNLRRDIAIFHLMRDNLSINEIAHRAGFTETSTFHRAFKKWTGLTPGAYREGLR